MNVNQLEKEIEKYNTLIDEEVVQLIHRGDNHALDYLIDKYKGFILGKARTYFMIGGESEDMIQEGMIGLYKAICDYDEDKLSSFKGFANLCITRQMITAIKTATRQKHMPLNSYVSLDKPIYDEESERTLQDIIAGSESLDPQELLINREKLGYMKLKLAEILSSLEREVLHLYIDGYSYQEISEVLQRHVKSIDNALQRVKRKLEQFKETNDLIL